MVTYNKLHQPSGPSGAKVKVNVQQWATLFNQEVRKAWKKDVNLKSTLRLKMPNQLAQAFEGMSKKLLLQEVIDKNETVKNALIKCRRDLKTNPKGFKMPNFVDSTAHSAVQDVPVVVPSVPSIAKGTATKGKIGAWDYKIDKKASNYLSLVSKRLKIVNTTKWCPLCRIQPSWV